MKQSTPYDKLSLDFQARCAPWNGARAVSQALLIALVFILPHSASALLTTHKGLTLQASIKKPDAQGGGFLTQSGTTVTVQILAGASNCVLMEETHSNININDGLLNLVIGGGTRTGMDPGKTLAEILENKTARTGVSGCTFTPNANGQDTRKVRVAFTTTDSGESIQADFNIRANAYAVESERLEGKSSSEFVQVNSTKKVTQQNLEDFFYALTNTSSATGVMWNVSSFVAYNPSNGSGLANNSVPWSKLTSVPSPISDFAGLTCTTGQVIKYNGSAWVCAADATGSSSGLTSLNALTGSTQTFAVGTSGTAPAISSSGTTHTFNIPMASAAGVTAGLLSKADYDNFTNKLSGTVSVASGGTGATSLAAGNLLLGNGTSAMQTLASGSAGNVLYGTGVAAWASGSPDTAGLVDKSSVQTISGAKAFTSNITLNAQNEMRFAESDSSNYVALRAPATVAANRTFTLPDVYGTSGQVLTTDGAGVLSWSTVSGGSSQWTSSGSNIYFNTGSVGIGTTSPSAKFHLSEGAFLAEGSTGGTPISGAGARMMWIPAKSAFRAGEVTGTQWNDANIGTGSIALSTDSKATNTSSVAIGTYAESTGYGALAIGYGALASGSKAISIGEYTTASQANAVAIGGYSTASGTVSTAFAESTASGARATSFARGTASGDYSTAMGQNTTAEAFAQTSIGAYNLPKGSESATTWVSTDPLFVIGNGTGSGASRSTAMMVLKNGNVGIGTMTPARLLQVEGTMRLTPVALPGSPAAGDLAIDSGDSNKLKYYNGSGWQTLLPSSGGITSLNGLTGTTQTFAIGTSGTAPAFSSSGTTHTLSIPMASTASVTAGLLSKTDYDAFTAKLGTSSTFSGDVSGSSSTTSVDKIKGKSVVPVAYATGQVLRYDGTNWVNAALAATDLTGTLGVANGGTGATSLGSGNLLIGGGTGAVTSLAAGSAGNVPYATGAATWASGSPDTAGLVDKSSTQTISGAKYFGSDLSLILQHALLFKDADSSNYIALRAPATVATDRTFTLPDTYGTNGQVLTTDGAGALSWSTVSGGSSQWTTSGSDIYRASGNVGFGTATPSYLLSLDGQAARTIGMERHASGSGSHLSLFAGSAASGVANQNGGNLILQSGVSTGNGSSKISFQVPSSNALSTSDNSLSEVMALNRYGLVIGANIPSTPNGYSLEVQNNIWQSAGPVARFTENTNSNAVYPSLIINRFKGNNGASAPAGSGFGGGIQFDLTGFASTSVGTAGKIVYGWESAQTNDSTDRNSYLAFHTTAANTTGEKLRIDSNGRVGIGTTGPTSRLHGNTTLNAATGNEVAYELDYTTNKATSGNDTGLLINMTDTASPGTSLPLEVKVGGVTKFSVDNTGKVTGDGSGLTGISGAGISGLTTGMIPKAASATTIANSVIKESSSKIGINTGANALAYPFVVGSGDGSLNLTEPLALFTNAGASGIDIRNSSDSVESYFIVNASQSEIGTISNHPLYFYTNNASAMVISTAQRVGINTASPGARLDVTDTSTTSSAVILPRAGNFTGTSVNGMIRYNTTSNAFQAYQNGSWVTITTSSDRRLKTNIAPVTEGLDLVNQLNPVYFDWDPTNPRTESYDKKHQVGFIAQEVEQVVPEVVNKGADTYRTMEYGKLVAVVVAAVKELYQKVLGIDEEVETLKAQLEVKDQEIEKLKEENIGIKSWICSKDPSASICSH